jgi:hypothetical protein
MKTLFRVGAWLWLLRSSCSPWFRRIIDPSLNCRTMATPRNIPCRRTGFRARLPDLPFTAGRRLGCIFRRRRDFAVICSGSACSSEATLSSMPLARALGRIWLPRSCGQSANYPRDGTCMSINLPVRLPFVAVPRQCRNGAIDARTAQGRAMLSTRAACYAAGPSGIPTNFSRSTETWSAATWRAANRWAGAIIWFHPCSRSISTPRARPLFAARTVYVRAETQCLGGNSADFRFPLGY